MITTTPIPAPQGSARFVQFLCIGLLMQGLAACSDADAPAPGAGAKFPLAALGQAKRISKGEIDLDGKTLLINFWATWCEPCRSEMPVLQQLSDSLDPERFAVIGVSVDEDSNLVREFMLQYKIRFHNFQDDNFQLASDLLGIQSYPQTFIVSPQGVITRRISEVLLPGQDILQQLPEFGANTSNLTPGHGLNG
jgi:thiol-disulfide isomerase/thioredoxin